MNNPETPARAKLHLLNRKHCKDFILSISRERRNGRFSRVSDEFLLRMEARLKNIINDEVYRHPSVGVTLK